MVKALLLLLSFTPLGSHLVVSGLSDPPSAFRWVAANVGWEWAIGLPLVALVLILFSALVSAERDLIDEDALTLRARCQRVEGLVAARLSAAV